MNAAVIVAAGRGTRMGPDIDKIFLPVLGIPLIAHTWRRFGNHPAVDRVVLVVREGMQASFEEIAATLELKKPFRLVPGGKERQDSVWAGLVALDPDVEIVAIQDGARPCTSPDVIGRSIEAAGRFGASVAAQRMVDTIKASDDGSSISEHLDRNRLWAVQTPQTFRVEVIRRALKAVREKGVSVTDDTAACELIGQKVQLVESVEPNPKLTHQDDVPLIERLLASSPE